MLAERLGVTFQIILAWEDANELRGPNTRATEIPGSSTHLSIDTTNIYAETDLEMKAKALATCEVKETKRTKRWKEDKGLMAFLRAL